MQTARISMVILAGECGKLDCCVALYLLACHFAWISYHIINDSHERSNRRRRLGTTTNSPSFELAPSKSNLWHSRRIRCADLCNENWVSAAVLLGDANMQGYCLHLLGVKKFSDCKSNQIMVEYLTFLSSLHHICIRSWAKLSWREPGRWPLSFS